MQHYAAHSHHYWPDVTREAMAQYWDDSARLVDDKWNYFFSNKVPQTQMRIAEVLNLSHPRQIVFAPNTHEFVVRLLSCFKVGQDLNVLTTDSEFYSFDRQINRVSEIPRVHIDKVPTQDFATFEERFIQKIKEKNYDLIFLSQVFFNSGVSVQNLKSIVQAVTSPETIIAVDGYHAFMAVPTDLKEIEDRIFYIAGSYKYAQGGEGCCFMHVPKGCQLRPQNTGWFAGFSELTNKGSEVIYSDDGYRFAGSTMDFSGLYRLLAVLELFHKENITVDKIHRHVQSMQHNFLSAIAKLNSKTLNERNILKRSYDDHGHFFAFELQDAALTKQIHDELNQLKIKTDYRGSRLRFGFGLYQEECIDLTYVKNL
ncbi:MAG: aminotransferase class V-fold PLP-dependent enzyme [Pseudobdellovibrio sp.]